MGGFAWFQDGVTYGGADMATYNALSHPRGSILHLFSGAPDFTLNSDQAARTVKVEAGSALVGHANGGGTWVWSPGDTLAIPAPSNLNSRRDLIIARLTDAAADGIDGVAVEIIEGTPDTVPVAPERPENAVALGWVDVPKATTTFTITPTRHTGQYRDQAIAAAPGTVAVDWGGQLPEASAFRPGAVCVDLGTNQRWTCTKSGTWFTADPGPWRQATLQNVTAKDGTTVKVSGELWLRETSTRWDLSGQVIFTPAKPLGLVTVGMAPKEISRPRQNTYGATALTFLTLGVGRIALMTNGSIEFGSDGAMGNMYLNETLAKSPWNS
ncbi:MULTISPECIES: hypothetical protein [Streptomyces]|uniref:hypothetical protein n=1 Tax=Streptomyces TaxID=1883 RepID=UPI000B9ED9F6|nr:hypothetical protein [Streptomyces kasugaensis]